MPHLVDHTIKTRLLLRPIRSPLGTIRLAGVNQEGVGVGMAPSPLRTLSCYTFNLILNGSGYYRDQADELTPMQRGDIAFSFPGVPHGYGTADGDHWDELWFEFEGPVFDLMLHTGVLDPRRPVHRTGESDLWFRRFFRIIPPLHLRQRTPPQVIVTHFVSVLTEMLANRETPDDPVNGADDWVNHACELLSQLDPGVAHDPAAVARRLGLSYETFRKRFRAQVGFSPGQFQLDARIDRAAALLHQGRLQVKEIAEQLEFCDEFHFSRTFKRRFGQSPREFRSRIQGR